MLIINTNKVVVCSLTTSLYVCQLSYENKKSSPITYLLDGI